MTRSRTYAAIAAGTVLAAALALLALVPHGAWQDLADRAGADIGGADLLPQTIAVPDQAWVYGATVYFEAGRPSSGNPVVVTSQTPDVCVPYGPDDTAVRFVAAGPCAITLTQQGDGTYATTTAHLGRSVAPRTLFVSVGDASRPTGTPNPTFAAQYDGFVLGDTVDDVTTRAQFLAPPPGVAPGTYAVVPYGAVAANYVMDYTPGTLTVTATMPNPEY